MADSISSLLVIGGGAMATAILRGAEASGRLPGAVCVVEPDDKRRAAFPNAVSGLSEGLDWLNSAETGPDSGAVMLAVKPQMLGSVAAAAPTGGLGSRLVVSILAGVPGERVRSRVGGTCRVVRVMPNTPAQIGRGTTAIAASAGASPDDAAAAGALFRGVGDVVIELDESRMDAFTAVAGSGPAYLFYLAEAMEAAAEAAGLPPEHARAVVAETLAGSAELLRRSGDAPRSLREAVTSKRGTTQAATDVLDEHDLQRTVRSAVLAARDRGRELGAEISDA
ncbi:MAG: pyrroline-5-carboxylate reductase [Planctomycetota bacterium]